VPSDAPLQSDVIVSITAIDGSATSKYHKHIASRYIHEYLAQSKLVSGSPVSYNNHTHFLLFYSTAGGSDFIFDPFQFTFDIGARDGNTISFPIIILDDLLVEGTETFTLTGSVVNLVIPAIFVVGATITILDNDGKWM